VQTTGARLYAQRLADDPWSGFAQLRMRSRSVGFRDCGEGGGSAHSAAESAGGRESHGIRRMNLGRLGRRHPWQTGTAAAAHRGITREQK